MTAGRIPWPPGRENHPVPSGLPGLEAHETQLELGVPALPELECSVGVMAYNEQANVAHALDSILRQKLAGKRITEVIWWPAAAKTGQCQSLPKLPVANRGYA